MTVTQTHSWLSDLKNVVNYEDTNTNISEAQTLSSSTKAGGQEFVVVQNSTSDNDGFLNSSIR